MNAVWVAMKAIDSGGFMFRASDFFYGKKNDHQLERLLKERLAWDKRVSLYDIQVEVISGHVVLHGKVDAEYKQKAAVEIAKSIEGVLDIDEQIEVDPYMMRSDAELETILETVMGKLWLKPGEEIRVRVTNAVVKLEGTVLRRHIKSLAESLAWELSCVRDVHNLVELNEGSAMHMSITPGELMQFI
jgi:hyperosmotically inducible protein